ncbi:MAG: ABC transporter ATP-binding protein [Alphaproteobacteria bacterium]|nr:ABC transporter ATP-binding protein [Alphaproteobacteria bacterium]
MSGPAYLGLRALVKSYDGVKNAVDGIDVEIARGEFVTFLGPSGSGKTTTLLMIAGFEDPTAGDIMLEGQSIVRVKPYRRNIGMVFQNYALFPHMTVAKNVGFPLRMRGIEASEATRRVEDALDLVGLRDFSSRHPRALSGGQQQRVALARALVFQPDVLLLDEPLGALDKNLREQMQVEIKRIQREVGITAIYVTHDQTEAMTMSDRIAVFNDGRIEQLDTPLAVYRRPTTRFVGGFVGDSNFLDGRIASAREGRVRIEGLGEVRVPAGATAADGAAVAVLVRPEDIVRADGAARMSLDNRFEFVVRGIVNYGDTVMVMGETGGLGLRIRMPGRAVGTLAEGERIGIGWRAEDGRVLAG